MWQKITIEEYLEYPALRSGDLKEILRSPKHYKAKSETVVTKAMRDGSLFHKAVLEPDDLEKSIISLPEDRKGQKGKPSPVWDRFLRQCYQEGKLIEEPGLIFEKSATVWENYFRPNVVVLAEGDRQRIDGIKKSCQNSEVLKDVIGLAETELTGIIEVDPHYGDFKVKTRPDGINRKLNIILDLKFTKDARRFKPIDMGYDIQSALHLSVAGIVDTEFKPDQYMWIVFETEPPFDFKIYGFNCWGDFHEKATKNLSKSMKIYGECLRKDVWPGYDQDQVIEVNYPYWYK